MDRETLAEVLANMSGRDPNHQATWEECLGEADRHILAASLGEAPAWWEE